jgi:hypothetical protein
VVIGRRRAAARAIETERGSETATATETAIETAPATAARAARAAARPEGVVALRAAAMVVAVEAPWPAAVNGGCCGHSLG